MKYLGIDYGIRKTGLALSDDGGSIAMPLSIIETKNILTEIIKIILEKKVDKIVIGESVNSRGEHNNIWMNTLEFMETLKVEINKLENNDLEIILEKEFFTSMHARDLHESDDKKEIDDRAAALILQRYLDKQNNAKHIIERKKLELDEERDNEDL